MTEVLKAGVLSDEIDLGALAHNAAEQAEEFVRKVSLLIVLFVKHMNAIILLLVFKRGRKFKKKNVYIYVIDRFGKPHGKFVTIVIYRSGCKTIIFCIEITDRRYHHFGPVLNQCSEFILKLAIYGHIYSDVWPSLA